MLCIVISFVYKGEKGKAMRNKERRERGGGVRQERGERERG